MEKGYFHHLQVIVEIVHAMHDRVFRPHDALTPILITVDAEQLSGSQWSEYGFTLFIATLDAIVGAPDIIIFFCCFLGKRRRGFRHLAGAETGRYQKGTLEHQTGRALHGHYTSESMTARAVSRAPKRAAVET